MKEQKGRPDPRLIVGPLMMVTGVAVAMTDSRPAIYAGFAIALSGVLVIIAWGCATGRVAGVAAFLALGIVAHFLSIVAGDEYPPVLPFTFTPALLVALIATPFCRSRWPRAVTILLAIFGWLVLLVVAAVVVLFMWLVEGFSKGHF